MLYWFSFEKIRPMNPAIKILAFSSSRVGIGGYLESVAPVVKNFLGNAPLQVAFIPFASVNTNYVEYTDMVRKGLSALPVSVKTVTTANAKETIEKADVIMVGGGNTFKLLHDLYYLSLMEVIKNKVGFGTPYIGWSAGSNIVGETICTSNDMPIIYPDSFNGLSFLPFQINPHYYNQPVVGFNGETRDQRLSEFLQLNQHKKVVALPEGTALKLEDEQLTSIGFANAICFKWDKEGTIKKELPLNEDLSFLLH